MSEVPDPVCLSACVTSANQQEGRSNKRKAAREGKEGTGEMDRTERKKHGREESHEQLQRQQ